MEAIQLSRRSLLRSAALSLAFSAMPAFAKQPDEFSPFSFHAPDDVLSDLKRRLQTVRFPEAATEPGFAQGPQIEKLQVLTTYWRDRYDWRRTEVRLNGWPQFKTEIDGLGIHFLHVRSKQENALPIILTHGWPSTILLFQEIIEPLTDPTAHGGKAEDAFHVVIPSLPGFGFSDKPSEPGWNAGRTARAWTELMQRLGYGRYVAQGGDWGAFVTTALAQQKPQGLEAIHLNFAQTIPDKIPEKLEPDQKKAVDAFKKFQETGFGYAMLQATKPQLAGYLLSDSPMAQAAWLYDIFDGGTGATGKPEDFLSLDHMLDEITLYWLTNSSASSARFYHEQAAILKGRNNPGVVELPVGVSVFPHDLPPAKSWAPLVYPNLFYWNELNQGGHFAQLEVPDLFVAELRSCFSKFR
ncbi:MULTISPECIES: epoxide hydrolase [unclassified Mesorhizobium]|uniref:epoxide hydrolase family protein n=1 Tax=unclassified Mesorhizobium TaxID=325217 RepID=UPI001093839E|nr:MULTISPECIES: epoxide hydrolase [unclassified Mesorhizobium]TGT89579.1 epoxide hydrolase [Mesorhizobium sp. M8A.F.Ca.ET.161.01.1.1]TGV42137.1 epoxide hydrolase [Mesorhizobium sp. M8A.F.Ca.ET.142.01.1.1]